MTFKLAKAFGRRFAETFPELVALVKQAGIARIRAERRLVGAPGFHRFAENVEKADAETAPRNSVAQLEFCGALPARDRLAMTAAIIQEMAEIERRACIARILGESMLEDRDLLDARG